MVGKTEAGYGHIANASDAVRHGAGLAALQCLFLICSLNSLINIFAFGGTNLHVVLTAATPPTCLILVCIWGRVSTRGIFPIAAYMLFIIYAVLRLGTTQAGLQAYQNVAAYLVLGTAALLAFQVVHADGGAVPKLIRVAKTTVWLSTAICAGMYIAGETGTNGIFALHAFVMISILGCCIYVAEARANVPLATSKAVFFAILSVATVSRTGAACALLVLATIWFNPRKFRSWIVTIGAALLAVGIFYLVATQLSGFRASFFGGDQAVQIAGYTIDTKGRMFWWELVWNHFLEAPLFGHGPGTALIPISNELLEIIQPHNDHLRLLHDLGIAGYALWLFAVGYGLRMMFRAWCITDPSHPSETVLLMSALLFSGSFLAVMVTDNVLIYFPVIVPFAVLFGAALAVAGRRTTRSSLA